MLTMHSWCMCYSNPCHNYVVTLSMPQYVILAATTCDLKW
ncbi:unnamed protein product [Spirodela intermedia]|uniref:Uncharacterized protein n=2 Tax=Spirodela intermedia TaxID=51605 RepID=A0A7I8LNQ6_SPIIN|nr:unnamed protein product [Spirodela intermedia]CAA6673689.1 unnamed protein product [Spirodela intermedia]CAA7410928.1 unnamed protein product [Spirodela intermedia]